VACGKDYQSRYATVRTCSLSCGQRMRCAEGRGRISYPTEAERKAAELARWQRKNRSRRAVKRGADAEHYTTAEIAARDKHRCQLCGGKVDMALRAPDPMSPTIDHIVPISRGGDDTKANVQLAHLGCNSSKGNRGGGEQLMLVG